MGHLQAFGTFTDHSEPLDSGPSIIPVEFLRQAQWNSDKLATEDPPRSMRKISGVGTYFQVSLDKRQLEKLWKPRSIWSRMRKHSPVERIGLRAIFEAQDEAFLAQSTPNTFDQLFGPDND